ncbi:hypothetical protein AZE42_04028 [Rhizopogon vesiculosus]|uniref:DUF6534 domain-containing protein n=1 Tax=Rhizopogon vesiculosus TaxID=180088 RepID=A0A1J8QQT7_9AGAM|nr:hypothetical protein AZE42_04028 [Rhizopogon vesiculosus]
MVEEREVVLHFDNTLGALLTGFAVSATAFGMLTIQVYTYYRRFPQDKVAYRVLAALIWSLSLVDQVFIGNGVYFYNVTNFLNPLALIATRPQWSLILQMTLGAVVGAIVKGCFALRVWRFSYKNWWLTGFLFSFIFAQFVGSLSLGLGVVTDMCIAAALFIYLQKMHSSYANTESLINKLTIYAVNTGLLTSTFSASTLILFNLMPTNFVFIGFYFVLSKLYAISFLATLNTRKIIRGRGTDREGGKTSSFQMVTESMRRSVQIPIQAPMPTIRDGDWPARSDSLRKNYDTPGYDSSLSTTRLTTHCVTV